MLDSISAGLAEVARFVPQFLLFLVILIVGLLIAKAIQKGLSALLTKIGFDRWVERGGVKRALAGSNLDASDIVAKIIYYALVLLVLQFAFGVFGPNPVSDLLTDIVAYLPRIVVAIIIVIVAAAIAAAVKSLIHGALGGLSYGRTLGNLASILIIGIGIIAALNQVDIAVTVTTPILIAVLAAIAGVIIVGVGGGLIRPMSERWERYLSRAESDASLVRGRRQASMTGAASGTQAPPSTAGAGMAGQGTSMPPSQEQRRGEQYPPPPPPEGGAHRA